MSTLSVDNAAAHAFDEARAKRTPGPDWLASRRATAWRHFCELGFPSRRDEDWKYNDLRPITEVSWRRPEPREPDADALAQAQLQALDGPCLVLVDGRPALPHSQLKGLDGVSVKPFGEALADPDLAPLVAGHYAGVADPTQVFGALNTVLAEEPMLLHVSREAVLPHPLHILHLASGQAETALFPRLLIVLERGSEATVVEQYVGPADCKYLTVPVTEVALAPGARLAHHKLQVEGSAAWHLHLLQAHCQADATFSNHSAAFGGACGRLDAAVQLAGSGAHATLNGVYLARGKQVLDTHTKVHHSEPHCTSHELYKGILDDDSTGIFNGQIYVTRRAQKTDAVQNNKVLLLSKNATIHTKPQLEIFADDVKCTHGATVGQLDARQLYYLRTRGIDEDQARRMLTHAFVDEALLDAQLPAFREAVDELVMGRFADHA